MLFLFCVLQDRSVYHKYRCVWHYECRDEANSLMEEIVVIMQWPTAKCTIRRRPENGGLRGLLSVTIDLTLAGYHSNDKNHWNVKGVLHRFALSFVLIETQ